MGLEIFRHAPVGYVFKLRHSWSKRTNAQYLKTGEDTLYRVYSDTPKRQKDHFITFRYGISYPEETLKYWATLVINPPPALDDILWD
jgi:hypothetical protein